MHKYECKPLKNKQKYISSWAPKSVHGSSGTADIHSLFSFTETNFSLIKVEKPDQKKMHTLEKEEEG